MGEQIQRRFPEVKVVETLNAINAYLMVDPPQRAGADRSVFVSGAYSAADLLFGGVAQSLSGYEPGKDARYGREHREQDLD